MISKHQARSIIRKAVSRVPEGEEIRHLNIMPMMDMMTILLVAMIFQSANSAQFATGNVDLPASQSYEEFPEAAVTLTITKNRLLIEGEPVPVTIKNGEVDASDKEGGALGIKITVLSQMLGAVRQSYEQELIKKGQATATGKRPIPELFIIADKSTPYHLLFGVIASARAEEAGYARFRLIVLEKAPSL